MWKVFGISLLVLLGMIIESAVLSWFLNSGFEETLYAATVGMVAYLFAYNLVNE
jgi:hypothetical protein